jgi:hypothetical protein
MVESTLPVPGLLLDLVERGIWPADGHQAMDFEWAYPNPGDDAEDRARLLDKYGPPRVPVERIRLIHPSGSKLYLSPPPFLPSRQRTSTYWGIHEVAGYENFFAPTKVERDLMIEIGGFGHGSDQPIILDYQKDRKDPNVRRLAFKFVRSGPEGRRKSWDNHWVEAAPSFHEFARRLGFT